MPELQRILQPHESSPYPTRMDGDVSKIARTYLLLSWPQRKEAIAVMGSDRELEADIRSHPRGGIVLADAFDAALMARALKAYEEEWQRLTPEAIADLIKRAKPQKAAGGATVPTPYLANEYNADLIAPEVRRKLGARTKPVVIMDLGTGGGGTILPIVERLDPSERRRIHFILVDVMDAGFAETRRELERLGIGEKQVTQIKGNISKIGENPSLSQFAGDVDIVTGGASLHHVSDIRPTFSGAHKMLAKGGVLCFWDWGHAAWRAPTLYAAPPGSKILEHGRAYELGGKTVQAEEGAAFFSREERFKYVTAGRSPTEQETVKEMLTTWIGLLRYPPQEQQRFERFFDKAVARGEPINYGDYLKRLEGVKLTADPATGQPREEARIYYWEGHRPPELYAMPIEEIFGERPLTLYSTQSNLLYQMKVRKSSD